MGNRVSEDFILKVIGGQALRIEQLSALVNELRERIDELKREKEEPYDDSGKHAESEE